jgi:hypothetical protein
MPTLMPPKLKEELLLYVTTTNAIVSIVMFIDLPHG